MENKYKLEIKKITSDDHIIYSYPFHNGFARIEYSDENDITYFYFLDTKGKEVFGPFSDANDFDENGLALVTNFNGMSYYIRVDGKILYEDDKKRLGYDKDTLSLKEDLSDIEKKLDKKYCLDSGFASNGLAVMRDLEKDLYGYINKDMEIVIPCIYEGAYPFREDRAIVTNEQGETLAIDSNNKTIFKFDKAPSTGYYSDGHILQDCCGVYKDKYGKTSLNINKFYYVVTYFGKSRIIRADSTEELEKKVEVIINEIRAYYNDIINSIDKTQNTLNKKGIKEFIK